MIRLYYTGVVVTTNATKYSFILDGEPITLYSRDARDLISSIPKDERDCKVAFNQVTLKSAVTKGKSVSTSNNKALA